MQIVLQVLLTTVVVFSDGQSSAPTIDTNYQAGLSAYQEAKFDVAKEQLSTAWAREPQNPLINYNLGLAEFKLGNKGRALAFLRKAQESDPFFSEAQSAEKFVVAQLKVKALPHRITTWEAYRNTILRDLKLSHALGCTALLLLLFGIVGLKYWGQRRSAEIEAQQDSVAKLTTSPLSVIMLAILFFGSAVTTILKTWDQRTERATIIIEKVEARSGPSEDQAPLFDLFEGLEVVVRQSFEDSQAKKWNQITYPGGMTGWIPSDSLISHSSKE
ncbi:MAG: tetratricopeptide repeat protein [Bdellovibrionales bacterium]